MMMIIQITTTAAPSCHAGGGRENTDRKLPGCTVHKRIFGVEDLVSGGGGRKSSWNYDEKKKKERNPPRLLRLDAHFTNGKFVFR